MSLIEIENENGSAVVSSHAGATLRSLRARVGKKTFELISGAVADRLDDAETPGGVGSFIMAPWVNRIHNGLLVTEHGDFQLPVDSGEHAIHGTVRTREWDLVSRDEASAEFQVSLEEPWPFRGKVVYRIGLDGASLRQTLEVHSADGERSFPAAVGLHPWFRRSLGSDEVIVQVDAVAQWELDAQTVPSGVVEETDASRKLMAGGRFAVGELDDCFRFGDKRTAELRWPELTLQMTCSPEITHAMVYSPENSICVEPQTTAVNAVQLAARGVQGTGTRIVSPGSPLVATTVWSWFSD